jgi:hypothetical protein
MLRPKREDNKPSTNYYTKFARIFGLLMTLIYAGLGLFVIFAGDSMSLSIGEEVRYMLGGILILYGIVRFVRMYRSNTRNRNDKYDE